MDKQKILIIEDEIINAINIKNILEKRGYDVCDIGISTEEAITLTEKHNPDLILMDIILDGDKDGIDAIIEIKKKHDIPFIYCTANTNEQTLKKAKKTEPYGYIIKPISRKELESTVDIALYKFKMDKKLKESEEKFKNLAEKSLAGVYIIQDGLLKYVNPRHAEIFGYTAEEMIDIINPMDRVYHEDRQFVEKNVMKREKGNEKFGNYTFRGVTKKGDIIHVEILGSRTMYEGKPAVIGTLLDVTEQKKAEKLIETSLKEKQTLLKEIHHRVNNNMNIITSIIELKKMDINNSNAVQFLEDIQTRIMTISLIHEKLYKSKDIKHIDIAESIRSLSNDILNIYNPYPDKITLNVDTEHTLLTIDQAIPLSLLLNEVLSNAFKYAFPEGHTDPYEINISLNKNDDHTITLIIKDNGIGLPDDFDIKNADSLGLSLVDSLTKQLKGELEISGGDGTKVAVTFPEE